MLVLSFVPYPFRSVPDLPLWAAAGEGGVAIVAKRGRISAGEMRGYSSIAESAVMNREWGL